MGKELGGSLAIKINTGEPCGVGSALYLDYGGGYMNLTQVIKVDYT